MHKISSCAFAIILLFQIVAIAQTDPVAVTGGKIIVFGGQTSTIETPMFSATGTFSEHSESVWYDVCSPVGQACSGGATFRLPFATGIGQNIGTALPFESGNITIGGQTFTNVYYSGSLYFADSPVAEELYVTIPKFFNQRRKGTYRLTRPFNLLPNSKIKVCNVSMLSGPCPQDQLLFDGRLQGKGKLVITLRYNNQNPEAPAGYSRLIRKSFEYTFEP